MSQALPLNPEPNINTLIEDIYNLLDQGKIISDEEAQDLGRLVGAIIQRRLCESRNLRDTEHRFSMSSVGKPARQLWFEKYHQKDLEPTPPQAKLKFLIGDVWEAIILFLAAHSGHIVQDFQKELVLDGVIGHLDAVIDGVLVDVKSASKYAFDKFKKGELKQNDSFGYYTQISGYAKALGATKAAFLAANKETGALTLLEVTEDEINEQDVPARIAVARNYLNNPDVMPPRCYEDVLDGKSGNRKLGVNCSYCRAKFKCWEDSNNGEGLRVFGYSSGPVFLTHVEREPNVPELAVQ